MIQPGFEPIRIGMELGHRKSDMIELRRWQKDDNCRHSQVVKTERRYARSGCALFKCTQARSNAATASAGCAAWDRAEMPLECGYLIIAEHEIAGCRIIHSVLRGRRLWNRK